jgi:hypothetical protein
VISLPFPLLDERESNVYGDVSDEHDVLLRRFALRFAIGLRS